MSRALAWALAAFLVCTVLGFGIVPALVITVIATVLGT